MGLSLLFCKIDIIIVLYIASVIILLKLNIYTNGGKKCHLRK